MCDKKQSKSNETESYWAPNRKVKIHTSRLSEGNPAEKNVKTHKNTAGTIPTVKNARSKDL